MKQLIFFVLVFGLPFLLQAQLQDNFEDGNFDTNPSWSGNNALFTVNNEVLQLNATTEGTAFLSVPYTITDSTSWTFWIKLNFNPSASGNFPKIYLSADNADFNLPLNGYYLRIGESNANDAFELYRQDGSSDTFIYRFSTEGAMGSNSNNIARLQITRNDTGLWNFNTDYTGGYCFDFEGSVLENTYNSGSHFGFFCKYTVSNIDNFFFDDVYIDIPAPGVNDPLSLDNLIPVSVTDLQLFFSKPLDPISAETADNYTVLDGTGSPVGNPVTAVLENDKLVHLDLSNLSINSGDDYSIVVDNVKDCAGINIGINNNLPFQIFITEDPLAFDILINEIFADPSPSVGLPEAEFIELYNRSSKAINLEGLQLNDLTSINLMPTYILLPESYVTLCDTDDVPLFAPYGNVLGFDEFPALNNEEDNLSLLDVNGNIIHEAFYILDWYQDSDKAAGGWTLELINPELYCQGSLNWRASNSSNGGTPGQQNSIYNNAPDNNGPQLLGAAAVNDHQVRLFFNEILSNDINPGQFQLSGNTSTITSALLESPENTSVLVEISSPFFQNNISYTITTAPTLTDCSGNPIAAGFESTAFIYYETEPAEAYDILINEIYADPSPSFGLPEAEYLELYNHSDKNINLEDFILADRAADILLPNQVIPAGAYLILYKKGTGSFSGYGDTLALTTFIGLGNGDDDLVLINPGGDIIHAVNYSINWYQDSGKSDGGWSLELINPNNRCDVNNNWRASVNPTGGTPGRANSIIETTLDETPLDLICASPESPSQIRLFFNKAVDANTQEELFEMDGFDITSIFVEEPLYNTVLVNLSLALEAGQIYTVSVKTNLADCMENEVGMFNEVSVALPQIIEPLDIIINEILFNPQVGGDDFVEIHNRSNKVIDISKLVLGARDERDSIYLSEAVKSDCLLFPSDYIALTEDPFDIRNRYMGTSKFAFAETGLPTYEDKEGTVVLYVPLFAEAIIIDEFQYSESMQYPLLSNRNGVSLERIDPNAITQSEDNWHSAAASVGYATPTYQNSQFISGNLTADNDFIWLDNDRLSPDNDGFEDFLQIQYAVDRPGYTANLRIYDAKGRLIKILTENELLLLKGIIKWDGVTDSDKRARTGIHLFEATLIHPDGAVKQYKKAFVVASRLD